MLAIAFDQVLNCAQRHVRLRSSLQTILLTAYCALSSITPCPLITNPAQAQQSFIVCLLNFISCGSETTCTWNIARIYPDTGLKTKGLEMSQPPLPPVVGLVGLVRGLVGSMGSLIMDEETEEETEKDGESAQGLAEAKTFILLAECTVAL
jgi:hypothetical protein